MPDQPTSEPADASAAATVADAAPAPAPTAAKERVVVIPTRGYWTALLLSLLCLALAAGLYRTYLPFFAYWFYAATVVVALVVIVWSVLGLARRGRVLHRTVVGTRHFAAGLAEGAAARSEAREGAMDRFAGRWAQRVAKLSRAVVWIVMLPIRIVVWAWYTAETLAWRIVLLGYDILYYPTYAAWLIAHWAVRTAIRVAWFLLGVAWKVVRLPLYLPFVRTWWRRSMRPRILANWRLTVQHHRHRRAMRIEKGRRLAHLRGEDPDRWEADHRLRRGFPLPHPERGRQAIRKRIAHIREVQKARREGRPIPRRRRPKPEEAQDAASTTAPGGPAATAEGPATAPEAEEPKRRRRLGSVVRRGAGATDVSSGSSSPSDA